MSTLSHTLYPPGDKLTFSVFANGSLWVNITPAGKVTFTSPINFWGTVNLTFSATDISGNIATGPCRINGRHVNQPPQVRSPPPDLEVNEDDTLSFDFSRVFWDPDGDPITLLVGQNLSIHVLVTPGDLNVSFKPDPEVSVRAARGLGVPAGRCLAFEDSVAGVVGALAAGMRVGGIGTTHDEVELLAAGALPFSISMGSNHPAVGSGVFWWYRDKGL